MKNTLITFFFLLIINHLNAQKTAPTNIKSIQFQSLNKTTFNHIIPYNQQKIIALYIFINWGEINMVLIIFEKYF